jgi:hypothetical protein
MMALPILLVLLIVVKGFGWPLLCVLLVILVALILKSIEARRPAYADTTALGLLALVFVSMGLFWGRFLSDAGWHSARTRRLRSTLPAFWLSATIRPTIHLISKCVCNGPTGDGRAILCTIICTDAPGS